MSATNEADNFRNRNRLLVAISLGLFFLGFPDSTSPEFTYRGAIEEATTLQRLTFQDYARYCVNMLQLEKASDKKVRDQLSSKLKGQLKYSSLSNQFRLGYVYTCPFHRERLTIRELLKEIEADVKFERDGPPYDLELIAKMLANYDATEMDWRNKKTVEFLTSVNKKFGQQPVDYVYRNGAIEMLSISVPDSPGSVKLNDDRAAVVVREKPSEIRGLAITLAYADFHSTHSIDDAAISSEDLKSRLSNFWIGSKWMLSFYQDTFLSGSEGRFKKTGRHDDAFPDLQRVLNLVGDLRPDNAVTILQEKLAGSDRQVELLGIKFNEKYATYLGPLVLLLLTLISWRHASKLPPAELAAAQEGILTPLGVRSVFITIVVANLILPLCALGILSYRAWVFDRMLSLSLAISLSAFFGVAVLSLRGLWGLRRKFSIGDLSDAH